MDVVLLCGLPASGKTTAAHRFQAAAGGALVRSCDVYQALGIDLGAWVRRTQGFTREVAAYERARDRAYVEMARRLERHLAAGEPLVILDAVHGERAKREVIYQFCRTHGARPTLLWCRCDDLGEVRQRIAARHGRTEPEHEADDLSVFRHIQGLWEDPWTDPPVAGGAVPVVSYDSLTGDLSHARGAPSPVVELIAAALAASPAAARVPG
ncbi:MAG: ATP-binding protein [Candidatus Rokubacteria bacterium]|nr:ATP-binding protein [Candidatus Rokubacteria bacterium]